MRRNFVGRTLPGGSRRSVGPGRGSTRPRCWQSVALLGTAAGAVVALVPDRSPLVRLGGFAAGFVVAWIGYVVRAALLRTLPLGSRRGRGRRGAAVRADWLPPPPTRLPLWTLLLGSAALIGAYEYTYERRPRS